MFRALEGGVQLSVADAASKVILLTDGGGPNEEGHSHASQVQVTCTQQPVSSHTSSTPNCLTRYVPTFFSHPTFSHSHLFLN